MLRKYFFVHELSFMCIDFSSFQGLESTGDALRPSWFIGTPPPKAPGISERRVKKEKKNPSHAAKNKKLRPPIYVQVIMKK